MSLLIKALEKAEKNSEKNKSELKDLELSLESLELSESAGLGVSQTGGNQTWPDQQQTAAGNVFSAKKSKANSCKFWVIVALLMIAALVSALLLFRYLDSLNKPELVMIKRPADIPPEPAPIAPMAKAEQFKEPAASVSDTPVEQLVEAVPAKNTSRNISKPKPMSVSEPDLTVEKPLNKNRSKQIAFGEPLPQREDTSVKVTRKTASEVVNPGLESAYQAYTRGDDTAAQALYRQVLKSDIRNVDALLGMGAISVRQGRGNDAVGWFNKVLEIEPRNEFAQASLLSLQGQMAIDASESTLKNMLAAQPDSATLHAALGSQYIQQQQWLQAQQAYFDAHRLDATNPEYTYNLAVSLDQLGKSAAALGFYKKTATLLSDVQNVTIDQKLTIDRAQLEKRIQQLQQK